MVVKKNTLFLGSEALNPKKGRFYLTTALSVVRVNTLFLGCLIARGLSSALDYSMCACWPCGVPHANHDMLLDSSNITPSFCIVIGGDCSCVCL